MSIFRDLGVPKGEHRASEEMLYNLAACYQLAERCVARVLEPHGLSPVKMNALLVVRHAGGDKGLPQAELGKRLIVTAGNVTRLIDRLESEGLVERVAGQDRRVKLVRVTAAGRQMLDRAWPGYREALQQMGRLMPAADVRRAKDILDGFRTHLKGRLV